MVDIVVEESKGEEISEDSCSKAVRYKVVRMLEWWPVLVESRSGKATQLMKSCRIVRKRGGDRITQLVRYRANERKRGATDKTVGETVRKIRRLWIGRDETVGEIVSECHKE